MCVQCGEVYIGLLMSLLILLTIFLTYQATRAIQSLPRLGCNISSAIQPRQQNLSWIVFGSLHPCCLLISNIVRWRATVLSVVIIPPESVVIWLLCFCDAAFGKMLGSIFVQQEIQPVTLHPRHHRHPFWESTWTG